MWKKYNNRNNNKRQGDKPSKGYPDVNFDNYKQSDAGVPTKPTEPEKYLSHETMKDLRFFSDSITVKADPYGELLPNAVPRAIINNQNRIIDGKYGSKENLFGNVLTQVTTSTQSKFLYTFDAVMMKLDINYLYLDYTNTDKTITAGINQFKNVISEAISKTYSETFINLPFFDLKVESNMKLDTTDAAGKLLATALTYQTILQNIAGIFNKYNQVRACKQLLLNMEWNRHAPEVTAYFGFLNKSSFKAQFESISTNIWGEYFDKNWYVQNNTLSALLSAKSDSVTDPLMEIIAATTIPTLKLSSGTTVLFDLSKTYHVVGETPSYTIDQIFDELYALLSPYNTLKAVRNSNVMRDRVNRITYFMDAVIAFMNDFKAGFDLFRTVLGVMSRVGINGWMKGPSFELLKGDNYKPMYNLIVEDIIKAFLFSSDVMKIDDTTLRWSYHSIWDKFYGIHKFDRYTGGSFITFSLRSLEVPASVTSDQTILLVPRMFRVRDTNNKVSVLNRYGTEYLMDSTLVEDVSSNPLFARLDLLGLKTNYDMRIPRISFNQNGTDNISVSNKDEVSAAYYLLNNVFKAGIIEYNDGEVGNIKQQTDYALSSDILGLVDVECDNISNTMITWIAQNAPFRTQTPTEHLELGFKS